MSTTSGKFGIQVGWMFVCLYLLMFKLLNCSFVINSLYHDGNLHKFQNQRGHDIHDYNARQRDKFRVPSCKTNRGMQKIQLFFQYRVE